MTRICVSGLALVLLLACVGCGNGSTDARRRQGRRKTIGDEEFLARFNTNISKLTGGDEDKAAATAALQALIKESPGSLSLLEDASRSEDAVARIRATIGLEYLSPDPDASWRRILQDGKAFSKSDLDFLLRSYSVLLNFGAISPSIDASHSIGEKDAKTTSLPVKELVSTYGEPDSIHRNKDGVTWYNYGPLAVSLSHDSKHVLTERILMADAFWAMLFKAVHGEYPEQLRVVGLPELEIELPPK